MSCIGSARTGEAGEGRLWRDCAQGGCFDRQPINLALQLPFGLAMPALSQPRPNSADQHAEGK